MAETVDARGLLCPQPVLMALSKMREVQAGEIEVMVDNQVSRENVSRAARKEGWELVEEKEEANVFHLKLRR